MLHDLTKGDGCASLKRAAEDRQGRVDTVECCQKPAVQQKTKVNSSSKYGTI